MSDVYSDVGVMVHRLSDEKVLAWLKQKVGEQPDGNEVSINTVYRFV